MKQAEDGNGVVLRLYEMEGKDSTAQITLFDKKLCIPVSHNSLKTVNENAEELDAMEWTK